MSHKTLAMFDPALVKPAIIDSFRKLAPRVQWRNPVMFVVYVGSILTTVLWGQALAGQQFDRDLAVEAERLNLLAGRLDVFRIGVEGLNRVALARAQGRGEFSITAAKLDHEAARDAGLRQDAGSLIVCPRDDGAH